MSFISVMCWFKSHAVILVMAATLLVGCSNPTDRGRASKSVAEKVTVYTVNYPLKYFADRIGGEHVDVVFPVPPDEDPAFWVPEATTVSAFQQADLILLNGATFAKWVPTVSLPDSKLVNTSKVVEDKYIVVTNAITHSHGPGQQHSHHGTAFTTWLDPEIALAQAEAIHQALLAQRPQYEADFRRGFESLKVDLETLDEKLRAAVGNAPQQRLLFSHPVYQYLTRKYGLNAESLHWEPDAFPTGEQWDALEKLLESHPAKWMIWEGAPLDKSVEKLSELGVSSVVFNPCGNKPDDSDWLQAMSRNVEAIARVHSTTTTD